MLMEILNRVFARKRYWTIEEAREILASGEYSKAKEAAESLHVSTPDRDLHRRCLLGQIAFRLNRDDEAETEFGTVLKLSPGFAEGHFGLSHLLLERGEVGSATEHAQFAKLQDPNDARYLSHLGLCYVTAGNYPSADEPLSKAVRLNAKDKLAWNNFGVVMLAKGDPTGALNCFNRAIEIDPGFQSAIQNSTQLRQEIAERGGIVTHRAALPEEAAPERDAVQPWEEEWNSIRDLMNSNRAGEALSKAEKLCGDWPDLSDLILRTADLYHQVGDPHGAIEVLKIYTLNHPDQPSTLTALGSSLLAISDFQNAEHYLSLGIRDGCSDSKVYSDLAKAISGQEKHLEAVEFRRKAFELENSFVTKAHLASALVTACQYAEAIAIFESLIIEEPSAKNIILLSYAAALAYSGKLSQALEMMDQALIDHPQDALIRMQRAQINLLLGHFAQGWEDYGYRAFAYSKQYRILPYAKWQGESLSDKSIVVLAEQGLGDQIMFASCLPDLAALGAKRVIVEAISRVSLTLQRSFPGLEILSSNQNKSMTWAKSLEGVDYFVPLADLPRYFRNDSTSFPRIPYLVADPLRVQFWKDRLSATGPKPWIGVSWRGGMQATRQVVRSMSALDFSAVCHSIDATWINLQYGEVSTDIETLRQAGVSISHWPEAIENLDEFAALIEALDSVVSVCNTTVHYAGALGKRTFVLAPFVPEWRYGMEVPDMPWYRNVRVLRQNAPGDWNGVCSEVSQHLVDIYERH